MFSSAVMFSLSRFNAANVFLANTCDGRDEQIRWKSGEFVASSGSDDRFTRGGKLSIAPIRGK